MRLSIGLLAAILLIAASPQLDGATIQNSGSTNFPGWSIAIHTDGSASLTQSQWRRNELNPAPAPRQTSVPADLVNSFFDDVKAAHAAATPMVACMKSVSFGTTTWVQWHSWRSPDLSCPQRGGVSAALARDVMAIEQAVGVSTQPRGRIPMLPNEPRRVPNEVPATSASPVPSP